MNKRMKLLLPVFCLALLMVPAIPGKAASPAPQSLKVPASVSDNDSIMPLSDEIRWVYKTENGRVYKRLFNYSMNKWIGNWILVS